MVFWFGVFQGGLTVLGWLVGIRVADSITMLDHWIAFGLLAVVVARMIRDGVTDDAEHVDIDARGPGVTIAVVTAGLTLVGVLGG